MNRAIAAAAILVAALTAAGLALRHRAAAPETIPTVAWEHLTDLQTSPTPQFDPAALPLDGRLVRLDGFITPFNLGNGTSISSFLMTGTPGTCPFCFGAGPEDFVIVAARQPVPIDITDQIHLLGRFRLLHNDPSGLYYRLEDASPAP